MEFEFMTAGTPLPPCMPLPPVLLRLPASSTAKVMYARMLEEALAYGIEDENGILYIHFPIKELAAALSRLQKPMAVVALVIHFKNGLVEYKKSLFVIVPALLFAVLGCFAAKNTEGELLGKLFGGFLAALSVFQFCSVFRKEE